MMLWTVASEPASWVAMLPQKFSAATTWRPPLPAPVAVAPQPVRRLATASSSGAKCVRFTGRTYHKGETESQSRWSRFGR